LRVQILLWTILPLTLLLIAFSLTGIRSHQRSMRTLVAERDFGLVQALADEVERFLDRYTIGLETLATSERLHHDSPQIVQAALIEASQRLDGMTLWLVNDAGEFVTGSAKPSGWSDETLRRLSEASFGTHQPVVLVTDDEHILLWRLALKDGHGWLLGALPVARLPLARVLDTDYLSPIGSIVLVDRDGHVLFARGLYSTGEPGEDGSVIAQALVGESGVQFAPSPQGEQVVTYTPVTGPGWALVLREPWEPLAAPLLRLDRVMPFVLVTAAVTSLLTLFFGLRYVVQPLQKLGTQADRIGRGEFDAAAEPVGGVREIEDLRYTLDRMARQVQRYQAALQDYLSSLTQTQEEERARLARELHDETVQTLIALSQRAQMVQRALDRNSDRAAERLAELRTMIGGAIEEVRRFSRALRPLYLEELGLVPALEMLAREAGAAFQCTDAVRRLSADQELALYRIAQEALSNAQRHAGAHQIDVSLAFVAERVTLRVQDDGTGFPVPDSFSELARKGHFGLLGMHERAQRAGGQLTLVSDEGHGTVVEVRIDAGAEVFPSHI
jgi:two-component system sensor histidine kinase UhpB